MASTTFDDRLRRLRDELDPAAPVTPARTGPPAATAPRTPAGTTPAQSADGRSGLRRAGPALRFGLGAVWLFGTMRIAASIQTIQDRVAASDALRTHEDALMLALVLLVGGSMVGFAWTLKRTVFRIHRRDAGWALSLGAVAGFLLGVGPQEVLTIAMADPGL